MILHYFDACEGLGLLAGTLRHRVVGSQWLHHVAHSKRTIRLTQRMRTVFSNKQPVDMLRSCSHFILL